MEVYEKKFPYTAHRPQPRPFHDPAIRPKNEIIIATESDGL
jgi:hypothetical protein